MSERENNTTLTIVDWPLLLRVRREVNRARVDAERGKKNTLAAFLANQHFHCMEGDRSRARMYQDPKTPSVLKRPELSLKYELRADPGSCAERAAEWILSRPKNLGDEQIHSMRISRLLVELAFTGEDSWLIEAYVLLAWFSPGFRTRLGDGEGAESMEDVPPMSDFDGPPVVLRALGDPDAGVHQALAADDALRSPVEVRDIATGLAAIDLEIFPQGDVSGLESFYDEYIQSKGTRRALEKFCKDAFEDVRDLYDRARKAHSGIDITWHPND